MMMQAAMQNMNQEQQAQYLQTMMMMNQQMMAQMMQMQNNGTSPGQGSDVQKQTNLNSQHIGMNQRKDEYPANLNPF